MAGVIVLVGTRKGLFIGRSDTERRRWQWDPLAFSMEEVYSVAAAPGPAGPRLFAGTTSWPFGPRLMRSDDLGASWHETTKAFGFPADCGAAVERVWQVQASPVDPAVVWAGTQPSALFRSDDGGETFELVRALWDHPHRLEWQPGAGGQALHTILPHPSDPDVVTVAMSTGGVYRSEDAGRTWQPRNHGIGVPFMPGETPEYGQCVHKVGVDAGDPDIMYAQNHGGVYRTDDAGRSWERISAPLPAEFGFPLLTHPRRPGTAYVFPLVADIERFPPGARPSLWRTDDHGASWRELHTGLPDEAYTVVLRDGLGHDGADPLGIYAGTRHGAVWSSADEGESWREIRSNLPEIVSVRAVVA